MFVTGFTTPAGACCADEFATAAYDAATGTRLWVSRTFSIVHISSLATAVTVSPDGYLLANSVQDAFTAVIDVSGLLFAVFYILTALATIAYYRRRIVTSARNALVLGVLPLAAAGFLMR